MVYETTKSYETLFEFYRYYWTRRFSENLVPLMTKWVLSMSLSNNKYSEHSIVFLKLFSCTESTQPLSSKRVAEKVSNRATHDLVHAKRTIMFSSWFPGLIYRAVPKPSIDASEKQRISISLVSGSKPEISWELLNLVLNNSRTRKQVCHFPCCTVGRRNTA